MRSNPTKFDVFCLFKEIPAPLLSKYVTVSRQSFQVFCVFAVPKSLFSCWLSCSISCGLLTTHASKGVMFLAYQIIAFSSGSLILETLVVHHCLDVVGVP